MSKIHELPSLQKIAKEQGLQFVALSDLNDHKIVPFNKPGVSIDMQFKRIKKRFDSSLCQDGEYVILMAESVRLCNQANRFHICKGDPNNKPVQQNYQQPLAQEVLSWQSAMAMHSEIATLKAEKLFFLKEIEWLQKENAELEVEVDALQSQIDSKGGGGGFLDEAKRATGNFLNEHGPVLLNLFDKHFDLKEREISLKEKGVNGAPVKRKQQTNGKAPNMVIGSPKHIDIIKDLWANDKEAEMNQHLDLLEAKLPKVYEALCDELGIIITEEEEENNGQAESNEN